MSNGGYDMADDGGEAAHHHQMMLYAEQAEMATKAAMPTPESGRWYDPKSGTCVLSVPANNGGERAPTKRDARKRGLVPSITTVLKLLDKPGLDSWRVRGAAEAALRLPYMPDETMESVVSLAVQDADTKAHLARARGTAVHKAIGQALRGEMVFPVEHTEPDGQTIFLDEIAAQVLAEIQALKSGSLVNLRALPDVPAATASFGGESDLLLVEPEGRVRFVIDFKTCSDDETKPYREYWLQVAGYCALHDCQSAERIVVMIGPQSVRMCYDKTPDIHDAAWNHLLNLWWLLEMGRAPQ